MVGEMPGRGNVLSGNCPQGICPQRTCTSGKCQSGICPWGSVSRGSVRSGNCRTILYKRAKAKGRCNSACTICFQTNENKSYMRMPRTPWRSHWFEEILTKLCSRNTGPVNQMGKNFAEKNCGVSFKHHILVLTKVSNKPSQIIQITPNVRT